MCVFENVCVVRPPHSNSQLSERSASLTTPLHLVNFSSDCVKDTAGVEALADKLSAQLNAHFQLLVQTAVLSTGTHTQPRLGAGGRFPPAPQEGKQTRACERG